MAEEMIANPGNVRNTDFFTESNLNRLKEIMYEHRYAQGSYLFQEGDNADKLYFIKNGRAKTTKSTPDGKTFILHMFYEGDLFGQLDGFAQSKYTFNAEIVEDALVGVILQKDLEILMWQYGDLAVEFMKWMGMMQRITETKFRDLILFGKPGALCSTLIRLCHSFGKVTPKGLLIQKRLTNTDLAEIIGATRESVNRMLSDFRGKDVLSFENGYILIHDLAYLQDICHCETCPAHVCRI